MQRCCVAVWRRGVSTLFSDRACCVGKFSRRSTRPRVWRRFWHEDSFSLTSRSCVMLGTGLTSSLSLWRKLFVSFSCNRLCQINVVLRWAYCFTGNLILNTGWVGLSGISLFDELGCMVWQLQENGPMTVSDSENRALVFLEVTFSRIGFCVLC